MAYRLAAIIGTHASAGIIAAALVALQPAFIVEPSRIATETLYIFFLALGLWLYTEYADGLAQGWRWHRVSAAGALTLAGSALGLATLTRGVSALFPLVIALHLIWLGRSQVLPNWRKHCLIFLLVYSAIISTWTMHNLLNWNRLVIVSDQLMGALWRGAESRDGSPQQNDKLLMDGVEIDRPADCEIDCKFNHATETYVSKIGEIVIADPLGYLTLRLNELSYSILQPYGAAPFGDVSIVGAGRNWLLNDRSLEGLLQVIRLEGFAIKLMFWIFHYIGLGFGLLGIYWLRKRWLTASPLAGFAAYTIAIHCFLLALPRYLFPIELVWLVFAGIALAQLIARWRQSPILP